MYWDPSTRGGAGPHVGRIPVPLSLGADRTVWVPGAIAHEKDNYP